MSFTNGEQLGEPMSFTNVSMGNSWGTHVFHKCVNGEPLGNTCLSQMCQWGTARECMSFINDQ